jgi:hypothetical protein
MKKKTRNITVDGVKYVWKPNHNRSFVVWLNKELIIEENFKEDYKSEWNEHVLEVRPKQVAEAIRKYNNENS